MACGRNAIPKQSSPFYIATSRPGEVMAMACQSTVLVAFRPHLTPHRTPTGQEQESARERRVASGRIVESADRIEQDPAMARPPTLVYIYGPPAVGKLTVATELEEQTGFRLFHNHLSIDAVKAVFEFKSPPFKEVIHRLRLDVFETAARHKIDLIFTNNSVWDVPDGRYLFAEFAEEARLRVRAAGGEVLFVQLVAPLEVLEQRVVATSRHELGKIVRPARVRELVAQLVPEPLHSGDVVIDTSVLRPADAASAIAVRIAT